MAAARGRTGAARARGLGPGGFGAVIGAIAMAVAVTGCTADPGTVRASTAATPDTDPGRSVATGSDTATPTPTPTGPVDLHLDGSWRAFDRVLVADDVFLPNSTPQSFSGDRVRVAVPGEGVHEIALTAGQPDGDLMWQYLDVAGDDDDLMLVVLSVTRVPSKGLEPEAIHSQLDSYDVETGKALATHDLGDADEAQANVIATSRTDVVAIGSTDGAPIVAVDARTGEQAWDTSEVPSLAEGSIAASGSGAMIVSTYLGDDLDEQCYREDGVDVATGRVLWTTDATTMPQVRSGRCMRLRAETVGADVGGVLAVVSSGSYDPDVTTYYDGTTGAKLPFTGQDPDGGDDVLYDLPHDLAVQYAYNNYQSAPLTVTDMSTDEVVYTISEERYSALDLRPVGVFGGLLYAESTDGSPVIDPRTGAVLADDTDDPAVLAVGDWVLFTDGTLTRDVRHGIAQGDPTEGTTAPTDTSAGKVHR